MDVYIQNKYTKLIKMHLSYTCSLDRLRILHLVSDWSLWLTYSCCLPWFKSMAVTTSSWPLNSCRQWGFPLFHILIDLSRDALNMLLHVLPLRILVNNSHDIVNAWVHMFMYVEPLIIMQVIQRTFTNCYIWWLVGNTFWGDL